ncbi:MAG: TIM barrel protein [Vicinamibacteria bacterium]
MAGGRRRSRDGHARPRRGRPRRAAGPRPARRGAVRAGRRRRTGDHPSPDETVARLAPFVPRFADAGVAIAIENHDRFATGTLVEIVERLSPENVGICLDTVNSFAALEGPDVVVERLAPYALNLHVKDFTISRVDGQMGFSVEGAPAGRGRLDVPRLLRRLAAAGRDVNAILELWTPRQAGLEETIALEASWAKSSVSYLRRIVRD